MLPSKVLRAHVRKQKWQWSGVCQSGVSRETEPIWTMHLEISYRNVLTWFSSVAQLCPTLWDPMDCSTPGLPVHHQLLEFAQIHVYQVSDAIQPSHPLSSPSLPAFNLSQHQDLFQWVSSLHQKNWLITWTTALSNSMKLWAMLCRATQDGWVMVESSDKTWFTGEGNGKPLQYSCLRIPWTVWKGKKIWLWKMNSPNQ